ncbi:MAG TPA: hypothetical protein PLP42_07155 [Acidobacteriota bacterium]|nr:hypothetical protein [Acidobacteriota bacterium]
MLRNLFLVMILGLCVLVGACSREQAQQAASSETAASDEQNELEQDVEDKQKELAELEKKLDEQRAELAERERALAEQRRAAPTARRPRAEQGASQPSQAAATESATKPLAATDAPAEAAKAAEPTRTLLRLEAGAPIVVRTTKEISTKTAKPGDTFTAILEQNLMAGEEVIAPRGTDVIGRVVESDPGGRTQGKAKIAVELVSFKTPAGKEVPITTSTLSQEAGSTIKKDATRAGIAAGVGAAIGAIAGGGKGAAIGAAVGGGGATAATLATRGDPSVIAAETVLRFELAKSVSVETPAASRSRSE